MTGIELISKERQSQIDKHGYNTKWLIDHPEYYDRNQLSWAAEMILAAEHEEGIDSESYPLNWPPGDSEKMLAKPYKERLIIAGALIAAELDRLIVLQGY